jgi:hypothetical protein
MPVALDRKAADRGRLLLHLGLLLLLVLACYWRLPWLEYVHFDDDQYVARNPMVQQGLSAQTTLWAFTSFYASNYHPLTWISHLLDVSLFGPGPMGGHLTNGVLHLANALLAYLFFVRVTRRGWPSFFLAAFWAGHPLRVESVAWVAERKDALSVFFWLATMHAYVWYARRPNWKRYLGSLGVFVLGLLSKPMLVTMPAALLLLDFWPLRRVGGWLGERFGASAAGLAPETPVCPARGVRALLLEKTPFLLLAAAFSCVTLLAQQEAMGGLEIYTIRMRALNALISCAAYVGKLFWPVELIAYYPHQGPDTSWSLALLCGLGLLAATAFFLRVGRRHGYAPVGWLWFLVTLSPVIGLIQVGPQAMADRYTYIPQLGLCLLVVWGLLDILEWRPLGLKARRLGFGLAFALLALLVWVTQVQVSYWRDAVALFTRSAEVAPSDLAFNNLGNAYVMAGRPSSAMDSYRRALELNPRHAMSLSNLGVLAAQHGRLIEAERLLRQAVAIEPETPVAHLWLGGLALERGDPVAAVQSFQSALRYDPDNRKAQEGLEYAMRKIKDNSTERAQ